MLRVLRFWLIVAAILGNGNASAQDYPTGPVKIILSNSAGGSPDIVARIVADRYKSRKEVSEASLADLITLPVLLVALLAQRHIVSGLTFGAVKQ